MRDTLNCLKKYIEVTKSEKFAVHWKRLSEKLLNGIREGYRARGREPSIVQVIENIINSVDQLDTDGDKFYISTKSVFVHGSKSQVEFEYHGRKTQRELGDIIFILSVVYNGSKYFEKMTITQVKKSKGISWNFRSESAREQLYLLSNFPRFKGVDHSLILGEDYNLPNYSGCLGSHGLLYYPGDFALVSSKKLEIFLLERSRLRWRDLISINFSPSCCLFISLDRPMGYEFEEILNCYHKFVQFNCLYFKYFPLTCNLLPVLGNECIAYNAYDFSDKYLRGYIGELIYAKELYHNELALRFLLALLASIEKRKGEFKKFVDNFKKFKYNPHGYKENENTHKNESDDKGGIGIIHTVINLKNEKAEIKNIKRNFISWI